MEVLPSHHRRQALVKVSRSIKHWRAGARDKGRGQWTGKPYVNKRASLCGGRRAAYRGDLRGERGNWGVRITKQEISGADRFLKGHFQLSGKSSFFRHLGWTKRRNPPFPLGEWHPCNSLNLKACSLLQAIWLIEKKRIRIRVHGATLDVIMTSGHLLIGLAGHYNVMCCSKYPDSHAVFLD